MWVILLLFFSVKPTFAACPVNMVKAGPVCVDKYEASVWSQPPTKRGVPRGTEYGVSGADYPCSPNGNDCSSTHKIYAVSAPGVLPSGFITWFQAQQACANVGKRLLTNAEWQLAVAGTPDDYSCNISSGLVGVVSVPTGSLPKCVSNWGVFDMVGNVVEWVADWWQPPTGTGDLLTGQRLPALYGTDSIYGANGALTNGSPPIPGTTGDIIDKFPAAIQRGGSSFGSEEDGVFMFIGSISPRLCRSPLSKKQLCFNGQGILRCRRVSDEDA